MFKGLNDVSRLLMEVEMRPVQGDRFQPTGFADIGHALYRLPDNTPMLLVETAQSMANRLEAGITGPDGEVIPPLAGMPYIRARLEGASDATTTSLIEAHRLNSPFIIGDKGFKERFREACGYKSGAWIPWPKVSATFFRFDMNSLIHGAFLSNFEDGRIRIPRALTAFIEARNVQQAVSGGVKNSPLDPTGKLRAVEYDAKEVYSNVPYHRVEYTAERITAFFNLDLSLLRSYGLPASALDLLVALSLLKVRRFLSNGTRLRTACDLMPVADDPCVTRPAGFVVPSDSSLVDRVRAGLDDCAKAGLFENPPVTELKVRTSWAKGADSGK